MFSHQFPYISHAAKRGIPINHIVANITHLITHTSIFCSFSYLVLYQAFLTETDG